jgi:hypothetical protein
MNHPPSCNPTATHLRVAARRKNETPPALPSRGGILAFFLKIERLPAWRQWILLAIGLVALPQNGLSVSLAWDADSGTDIAGYRLYYGCASGIYTNNVDVGNVTTATVSGLANGLTYYFAATAYDTLGLESIYSPEVSYTAASTSNPPAIVLTSPLNGAGYTAPATVNLAASVTANGHAITKVQFYNGANLLGEAATAPYNFAWTNVAAGTFSLSAQVIYDAGTTLASSPANVTVANPPPVVALTSPFNGAAYAAPATINLAASVTANGHNITSVQFYNGSSLLGQASTAPYAFAWGNVAAGTFSLSAQVIYDGGSATASTLVAVTVTNLLPTIVLTSPLNAATYSAPAVINLNATVSPNGHNITMVQFFNGANLLGQTPTPPYSFNWSNVSPGDFALTASLLFDSGGVIASSPVNVVVNGLPAPWETVDIGSVGLAGSAGYDSSLGTFTVAGSGAGIGSTADAFRFVWQAASGDCQITARVTSLQNTAGLARTGVMIRETLNANSRFADLVLTPANGAYFQYRNKTAGGSGGVQSVGKTAPYWVRATRTSGTFRGYISSDGVTWTQVGSRSITMAGSVYIGLCVTANKNTALNTSTFSNVSAVP